MLQKYQHCLVSLIMAGGVVFCWLGYMYSTSLSPNEGPSKYDEELTWHPVVLSDRSQRKQAMLMEPVRTDVLTVTPWLAPIVWEGTFDPQVIDEAFRSYNLTIATTVFAVGKYTRFLHALLESAEKHFMVGLNVQYYVFTDLPSHVPINMTLGVGRRLKVVKVPKFDRWQEISLRRMELIQNSILPFHVCISTGTIELQENVRGRKTAIEEYIHQRANYIFCLDVDMIFHGRVGPEALGKLVAAIHPWFYWVPRSQYPYERRTISKAYIPQDHGDFYYQANIFGGAVEDVHRLTKTCREHLEMDKSAGVEAVWQEESHLNWYLWKNKPTKLLSPEYVWDDLRGQGAKEIKLVRFSSVIKNKAEVRENP
ncbi:globoside alpha-1,3-N-acetylgalactosaminyltransferase 1-like isoform X1 [Esox lucius]|uniref:globoside alpha-1,3-N-acetylgalactosaminyltransferase 1-like isoform X1 n=1 Tax=Esox lucius TaxID=8010 RepID=UPI001477431C|nr:globoside alpha-1,3-N-acetylgalactosaminyltransferase 1-like isoform X1 [Esox lucius]XP_012996177.2 globoside alpha-1,3-N-acetylgalactosaminyltransferase 1-like isoform X1 [Esox lucius]XP_012996178.2 globoside alpha-1,3-N-acetylgalactosaminyltransferase 1-like isoform X1 [Esox lucius]